jgi:hypothetical protein
MRRAMRWAMAAMLAGSAISRLAAADEGFKPIFDGRTLEGWSAPHMEFWTVEDGAITAESTPQRPCPENQFLTWTHGEVDDFELKLKFRITGSPAANSGIQFRSGVREDGHVFGYQADIDRAGQWIGALYDELGRGVLAKRGQKVELIPGGRSESSVGDAAALFRGIDIDGWNDYHIIAGRISRSKSTARPPRTSSTTIRSTATCRASFRFSFTAARR